MSPGTLAPDIQCLMIALCCPLASSLSPGPLRSGVAESFACGLNSCLLSLGQVCSVFPQRSFAATGTQKEAGLCEGGIWGSQRSGDILKGPHISVADCGLDYSVFRTLIYQLRNKATRRTKMIMLHFQEGMSFVIRGFQF